MDGKEKSRSGKDIISVYMIESQEGNGKPDSVTRIGTRSTDDSSYASQLIRSSKEGKEVIYFTGLDKSFSGEVTRYGIHKYKLWLIKIPFAIRCPKPQALKASLLMLLMLEKLWREPSSLATSRLLRVRKK